MRNRRHRRSLYDKPQSNNIIERVNAPFVSHAVMKLYFNMPVLFFQS